MAELVAQLTHSLVELTDRKNDIMDHGKQRKLMIFEQQTTEVTFLRRPNRFQAWVELAGEELMVHVPNTGRLREILIPGCRALIRHESNPRRKTAHSLIGAWKGERLINFDSQIPNRVVEEALLGKAIPELAIYDSVAREKTFGASRFDFRLSQPGLPDYYLEVKGVTLEQDGIVSFPDAVTERGARHLRELVEARRAGHGAGLIFVVQLEGARHFTPNTAMDPDFTAALRYALTNDVAVMAYTCQITPGSLTLDQPIPIDMEGANEGNDPINCQ